MMNRQYATAGIQEIPQVVLALPPRVAATFEQLLEGLAEKQVANQLGLSRHTVHVYIKVIYQRFGVSSRSELLSLMYKYARARVSELEREVVAGTAT